MAKALSKAKLYIESDTTPQAYSAVGNLTSVGVPSAEKAEVDMTDMDSTAAESLPGMSDFGEAAFSGFYNPESPGQALVISDAQDPDAATRNFRIDLTNLNKRFSFEGYVLRANIQAELNSAYTLEGAIRVSGAVTESAINQ